MALSCACAGLSCIGQGIGPDWQGLDSRWHRMSECVDGNHGSTPVLNRVIENKSHFVMNSFYHCFHVVMGDKPGEHLLYFIGFIQGNNIH